MFRRRDAEVRKSVEAELDRVLRSCPGWQAAYRPAGVLLAYPESDRRNRHDYWCITHERASGSYVLEFDPASREFLLWFGHYQAGAMPSVSWILNPAVHFCIDDLDLTNAPSPAPENSFHVKFRLGDVLSYCVLAEGAPNLAGHMRYPMNYTTFT